MTGNIWPLFWIEPVGPFGLFATDIGRFGSLLALCVMANVVLWVVQVVLIGRQERRMARHMEDVAHSVRRMAKMVAEIRSAQQNISATILKLTPKSAFEDETRTKTTETNLSDIREGLRQLRAEMSTEPVAASAEPPSNDSSMDASQAAE